MAAIKPGWAFIDDADDAPLHNITDTGVYIVEKASTTETQAQATDRVRNVMATVRIPKSKTKNVVLKSGTAGLGSLLGLAVTASSATAIHLNWTPFSGATRYEVYRNLTGGTDIATYTNLIGGSGTTATTTDNTGLTGSTAYYYAVRALSGNVPLTAWAFGNATTLVLATLEVLPVGAVSVAYKADWLTAMAQNGTANMDVMNLLFDAATDEPLKVRLSKGGVPITGTIMATQSGKFMTTDKVTFYGNYEQRIRLDRSAAGVGGLSAGDVVDVVIYRETAPLEVMSVQWTLVQPVNTVPLAISLPPNPNVPTNTARARAVTLATWDMVMSVVVPDSANPTSLVVVSKTANTITLGWGSNNAGIAGFVLQKKLSTSSTWANLGNRAVENPGWVDTGLAASTSYDYQVRSVMQGGGYSAYTQLLGQSTASTGTDAFVDTNLTTVRMAGLGPFLNGRNPLTGGIQEQDEQMVEASLGWHMNCFYPSINRTQCINSDGSYDYRHIDSVLALANRLGIVAIPHFKMTAGTNGGENPDFIIPVTERAVDHRGIEINTSGATVASYDSTIDRASQEALLTAMLNRMAASAYARWVAGITVDGGMQYEGEYPGSNSNGTTVTADFSERALSKFRQRAQGWYATIGAANTAWGTSFSSFAAIDRVAINATPDEDSYNSTPLLRDFHRHRTLSLTDYALWWHNLVKAKSSRLKTIYRCGSLFDSIALRRGTITLIGNLPHDIVMQDNEPSYLQRYAHTLALRDQRASYGSADNPFQNDDAFFSEAQQVEWHRNAYDAYASCCFWEGFYMIGAESDPVKFQQGKDRIKRIMDQVHATHPIGGTIVRPTIDATLNLDKAKLMAFKTTIPHGNGEGSYYDLFQALRQNGTKQVAIHLDPIT